MSVLPLQNNSYQPKTINALQSTLESYLPSNARLEVISFLANEIFSDEQWHFLSTNYELWDPIMQRTGGDPNRVLDAQVICLGDIHDNNLMLESEIQFYNLFVKSPTLSLLEGFPPGMLIKKELISHYAKLPAHLTLVGSDNRITSPPDIVVQYLKYKYLLEDAVKRQLFAWERLCQEVSKIVNACFTKGDLVFCYYEAQKVIIVSDAVLQQLIQIWKDLRIEEICEEVNDRYKPLQQIEEMREDMGIIDLVSSNQGLTQEIIKTCALGQRVIIKWGTLHFRDDHLFTALDQAGITYQVLIPPKSKFDATEDIWKIKKMNCHVFHFRTKTSTESLRLVFSEKQKRSFCEQVREWSTVMEGEVKGYTLDAPQLTFTRQSLLECAQKESSLLLPDKTRIRMEDIPPQYFLQWMDEKPGHFSFKVLQALNAIFMFAGKQCKPKTFPYTEIAANYVPRSSTMEFFLDGPLELEIIESDIIVSHQILFIEMLRRNNPIFKVKANTKLILIISEKEYLKLSSATSLVHFSKLLSVYAPKG